MPATGSRSAASIAAALQMIDQLGGRGQDLCPSGTDRREWAWAVLRDLAAAVDGLERAVEQVAGKHNHTLRRHAHLLATAIEAHRNVTFPLGADRPELVDGDARDTEADGTA